MDTRTEAQGIDNSTTTKNLNAILASRHWTLEDVRLTEAGARAARRDAADVISRELHCTYDQATAIVKIARAR